MNTTARQSSNRSIFTAAIATALVAVALPSISHAEGWELRTVQKEVPGTREIESGNPQKAIRISKVHLSVTAPAQQVAVLTNLCIGHILIRDFEQAEQYCDQASARSNQKTVSYNNRGVLKALQGDYMAAQKDFAIAAEAGCFSGCNASQNVPDDLPRPVARRNLENAEALVAESRDATDTDQIAARTEQ